jgi:hypothetical protein
MLFNTAQFALFFIVVLVFYAALPARRRNAWLLGCSLFFYFLWLPVYLLLLLLVIAVNFSLMHGMLRSARPRWFLVASVGITLGVLGWFKYAAFLLETLAPVLTAGSGWSPPLPRSSFRSASPSTPSRSSRFRSTSTGATSRLRGAWRDLLSSWRSFPSWSPVRFFGVASSSLSWSGEGGSSCFTRAVASG